MDDEEDGKAPPASSSHELDSKHNNDGASAPNSSAPVDKDTANGRKERRARRAQKMEAPQLKEELLKSLTTNAKEIKDLDTEIARFSKRVAATQREIDYISSLRAALVLDQSYNQYCERRGQQPNNHSRNGTASSSDIGSAAGSVVAGGSNHSRNGNATGASAIELNSTSPVSVSATAALVNKKT
jgi:hypothetical protein